MKKLRLDHFENEKIAHGMKRDVKGFDTCNELTSFWIKYHTNKGTLLEIIKVWFPLRSRKIMRFYLSSKLRLD